jgi:hypothetical protein
MPLGAVQAASVEGRMRSERSKGSGENLYSTGFCGFGSDVKVMATEAFPQGILSASNWASLSQNTELVTLTRMGDKQESFLRKQAWDYFATHASQRMTIFNFYIVLSSVTTTTYFATFKSDSNLQSARWILAFLLCIFAFIFWKLDARNKTLIKNAEAALRYFEQGETGDVITKVFTNEEIETDKRRKRIKGWRRLAVWRWHLSYSDCFNTVFAIFALIGLGGLIQATGWLYPVYRWACPLGS